MNQSLQNPPSIDMFRPPIHRAMRILDRPLFQKDVHLAAACVLDSKQIATYRKELHDDLLKLERLPPIRSVPPSVSTDKSSKCLLLKPSTRVDGKWTEKLIRVLKY